MFKKNWGNIKERNHKKTNKGICSIIVALTLILPVLFSNTLTVKADEVNNNLSAETINEIIEQSKKESELTDKDFHLVSNENARIMANESTFILESIDKNENGDVIQTSILPYKILENGEMVDSFQYALNQGSNISPQATNTTPTKFVDVTITVITSFAMYRDIYFSPVYRHAGIEAYWSSSNSTVKVSNMLVRYDTRGDLYEYPSVVNNGVRNSTPLQKNYFKRSQISRSNPVKGTVYIDGNNTMPYNRVVSLTSYLDHKGLIYLKLNYVANGKTYEHDRSYTVYTK
ncbi:hypothetical protein [Bacillus niameyensis]|uniref:hypothetical protein n=1 Tax=Bacillus niameyensis TaxID=1522308 RepID=UPI0007860198|nr:hypothetical protein [Bacillus niameyensis]